VRSLPAHAAQIVARPKFRERVSLVMASALGPSEECSAASMEVMHGLDRYFLYRGPQDRLGGQAMPVAANADNQHCVRPSVTQTYTLGS
jgi:hypothetical protein